MRKDDDLCDRTKQFALTNHQTCTQVFHRLLKRRSLANNCFDLERPLLLTIGKLAEDEVRPKCAAKLGIVEQELDESMLWLGTD